MLNLEQLIGELLLRHNCVVIPSFGGFVAQQQSAKIDGVNGWIFPPKKSILFNKQLSNNDGLLINSFSKATDCTFDEATVAVKNLVKSWNVTLSKGERIAIDKVGFIFYDQEKNICFEQDRFFNLLLSSYGLGKVHFIAEKEEQVIVIEEVIAKKFISIVPEETVQTKEKFIPIQESEPSEKVIQLVPTEKLASSSTRKLWKYVAAACILPIAFYSVWIPMKTDVLESGIISFKDFNPLKKEIPSIYKEKELIIKDLKKKDLKSLESQLKAVESNSDTYQYNFSEDVFITVGLDKKNTVSNKITSTETPVKEEKITAPIHKEKEATTISSSKNAGFNYIVGCFGSEENAKNLVSKLKSEGLNGSVVDFKNGLYRVSAGTAASDTQFAKIISVAESKGYQGWVMK